MDYARKLAAGSSVAIDLARRCVFKTLTSSLDEILDYEAVAGTMSTHTQDAAEGTKAFIEKRKPVFMLDICRPTCRAPSPPSTPAD